MAPDTARESAPEVEARVVPRARARAATATRGGGFRGRVEGVATQEKRRVRTREVRPTGRNPTGVRSRTVAAASDGARPEHLRRGATVSRVTPPMPRRFAGPVEPDAPSARERQPMGSRQAMDRANGLFSRASSSRTRGETPPRFRLGASASGPIGAAMKSFLASSYKSAPERRGWLKPVLRLLRGKSHRFPHGGQSSNSPPAWRTTSPSCPHAKGRNFFQHAGSRVNRAGLLA